MQKKRKESSVKKYSFIPELLLDRIGHRLNIHGFDALLDRSTVLNYGRAQLALKAFTLRNVAQTEKKRTKGRKRK